MSRLHELPNQASRALHDDLIYLERDPAGAQLDRKIEAGASLPFDRRKHRGSDADALDDEFDDESLDGAWTRVDAAGESGHLTWTEAGDCLSARHTGTDTTQKIHGLVKPMGSFAIGDSVQTCARYAGANFNFPMAAVILSDGTTHGAGVQVYAASFGFNSFPGRDIECRRHTNWTTSTVGATLNLGSLTSSALHMRLKWVAANSFQTSYSPDGVSWLDMAAQAFTCTPTHLGLAVSTWAGAGDFIWAFDYFRVT